nr:uncharacterized protein LOC26531192 [Drosophila virilis]
MNSKKLNSSDVVEPVTIVSFCRTLLHEVLIFLLFFSISAVVFFVFFSALNSFAMMATNKPRPFKYCLWPKEWCSILNKQPKLHEPESLVMQQQHIERSRPKYDRFLDYMFRAT